VAQDLREWIQAAGYNPVVQGGGRIDYQPTHAKVFIYGTSNGFGKADHGFTSAILATWNSTLSISLDESSGYFA
jgi:Janus/Ocnus family (Ocnus)